MTFEFFLALRMFSSLKSVSAVLTTCTLVHFLAGLFTFAISTTASVDDGMLHQALLPYSIPAEYAISLFSIASFSLGLFVLRTKPQQRLIVDVFQLVSAVTVSVVVFTLSFKMSEIALVLWHPDLRDAEMFSQWRYSAWWGVVFGSAVVVGVAASLNVAATKAYIKLNFTGSCGASEFLNDEVDVFKCTAVVQLAAGLAGFALSVFGLIKEYAQWFGARETELLWYSASLEIPIALLTIYSAAKKWAVVKSSTRTKRQFDVLSTVNLIICAIVILLLALATVAELVVAVGFLYNAHLPQLWHYSSVLGMSTLVVAVVILAVSVITVKVSIRAAGSITPAEMGELKVRYTSGTNNLI